MWSLDQIENYLTLVLGLSGLVLVLLWLAVVVWAVRDIRARSRSFFAALLVLVLVAFLPVIGLVVYLLVRPRETLAEAYDRALEQEALLRQIEDRQVCPTCGRPTQPNWFLCPACHTHLRQPCLVCQSPLELQWTICPYCGHLQTPGDSNGASEQSVETTTVTQVVSDENPAV